MRISTRHISRAHLRNIGGEFTLQGHSVHRAVLCIPRVSYGPPHLVHKDHLYGFCCGLAKPLLTDEVAHEIDSLDTMFCIHIVRGLHARGNCKFVLLIMSLIPPSLIEP